MNLNTRLVVGILVISLCGQRLASASEVAWSMVVFPDTQKYRTATTWPIWNQMSQWVVDNKDARGIQVVLHEGDITDQNYDWEWAGAANAMGRLNGQVPYILATGNHDYYNGPLKLNDYFSLSDNPLNNSPDGIMTIERIPGDLENVYATFTAPDGRNMLIFGLEFIPSAEVTTWANEIAALPQYADYTAVVLTHHLLQEGPATMDGEPTPLLNGSGWVLWRDLISKHQNFEMAFNGHELDNTDTDPYGPLTTARETRIGDAGNKTELMVFNSQEQPAGGNGYLRLVEFMDDGRTVQIKTYSPYLDLWLTDNRNQFTFEITPLYVGDYNENGRIDAADYSVWRDAMDAASYLANDPTPGIVDETDFIYWRDHYGDTFNNGTGAGDYNENGRIDAADYSVWRDAMDAAPYLANDPTPGIVDETDFIYWRDHYGDTFNIGTGAGLAIAVPEPTGIDLAFIASLVILFYRR